MHELHPLARYFNDFLFVSDLRDSGINIFFSLYHLTSSFCCCYYYYYCCVIVVVSVYVTEYMVLENLTSKYAFPSVLDLKVGTRQHGDDSTPYKIAKHMHSCAISTSSTLGVRMAGLQVMSMCA